jgi:hypothetical protein
MKPLYLLLLCAIIGCGSLNVQESAQLGRDVGTLYAEFERNPDKILDQAELLITSAEFVQMPGEQGDIVQVLGVLAKARLNISKGSLEILNRWIFDAGQNLLTATDREALSLFLTEAAQGMMDQVQVRQAEEAAVQESIGLAIENATERLKALRQ